MPIAAGQILVINVLPGTYTITETWLRPATRLTTIRRAS